MSKGINRSMEDRREEKRTVTHAHVLRVGVSVDVMRVDVERDEADGFERRRLDNRHVVGRVDGHRGNVSSRAASNVRHFALQSTKRTYGVMVHQPRLFGIKRGSNTVGQEVS